MKICLLLLALALTVQLPARARAQGLDESGGVTVKIHTPVEDAESQWTDEMIIAHRDAAAAGAAGAGAQGEDGEDGEEDDQQQPQHGSVVPIGRGDVPLGSFGLPSAADAGASGYWGMRGSAASASDVSAHSGCVPVGECIKCTASQKQADTAAICRPTGYKAEYTCKADNGDSEPDKLVQLSCARPDVGADDVVVFEAFMVVGAVGSLYVVWQRKTQGSTGSS